MNRYRTMLIAAALALPVAASACMSLGPQYEPIAVADESAVIVWNEKTHTESFVRQADFVTNAHDFAFLVPTPTAPSLAAADPGVFDLLSRTGSVPAMPPTGAAAGRQVAAAPRSTRVAVIARQTVGGYDATVLKAANTQSLDRWLAKRGYQHGGNLRNWLAPYVAKGWAITAFRVHSSGPDSAELTPIRMTFHTDTPFYPYREPASARARGAYNDDRLLRVFFIGSKRMAGTLGTSRPWAGEVKWAGDWAHDPTMRRAPLTAVAGYCALPLSGMPATPWLTVFEDDSSPRPGYADVFFHPARAQKVISISAVPFQARLGAKTGV